MSRRASHVLLAACGSSSSKPAAIDAPDVVDIDAAEPDAATEGPCEPLGECAWLGAYQQRVVGALAGKIDVTPGVKLAHRASLTERDTARQFLLDELTALGYTPRRHDYTTTSFTGANVIADLDANAGTGTRIIVGAHFDGVAAGPGAADNATGVAMVLAAARYLRDVPMRSHPVTFVLFDQEELGLVGSKEYVKTLTPSEIKGAHIFDMLSWDGDGDHAVELWSPSAALKTVYEMHGPAAGTPISSVTFSSSDHQSFLDRGIPATGIGEEFVGGDHTPNYHKATDTYDNVQFGHLERVTHLMLDVLDAEVR
jgi:hypothetical protein